MERERRCGGGQQLEVTHRSMRRLAYQTQNKKQIEAVAPPPRNLKQMAFSKVEADAASERAARMVGGVGV